MNNVEIVKCNIDIFLAEMKKAMSYNTCNSYNMESIICNISGISTRINHFHISETKITRSYWYSRTRL